MVWLNHSQKLPPWLPKRMDKKSQLSYIKSHLTPFAPNCTVSPPTKKHLPSTSCFFLGHFLPNDLHQTLLKVEHLNLSLAKKTCNIGTVFYHKVYTSPIPWPCATPQHARMVRALEASSRPRRDTSKENIHGRFSRRVGSPTNCIHNLERNENDLNHPPP